MASIALVEQEERELEERILTCKAQVSSSCVLLKIILGTDLITIFSHVVS